VAGPSIAGIGVTVVMTIATDDYVLDTWIDSMCRAKSREDAM